MKASEARLLELIDRAPQFIIPIYQRTYSWKQQECAQLWDDLLRTGSKVSGPGHFVGSVVYIEQGVHQAGKSPVLVIDGQQRLTTVSLILEALARRVGEDQPVEGFSARKIRNYYLRNPDEDGDRYFKLLLTQTDRESLLALVRQRDEPKENSVRIAENFAFFTERIAALGDDLVSLCHGLEKLIIIDVALDRAHDNPQLIFESMNSTGRELSQADLIRNFVLMGLEPEHQTRLYEQHWRPMEQLFGQEAYRTHFDSFMRHYLTFRTRSIPKIADVYDAFKAYAGGSGYAGSGIDGLIADIHRFARYYCAMALDQEQAPRLAAAFADLRELKVDVAYPFLLEAYYRYQTGDMTADDLVAVVRLIETYVFRRAVCAVPTNTLNQTFASLGREFKGPSFVESVEAALLGLQTYRRFPDDEEFRSQIQIRDVYNFRNRSYLLRRLENYDRQGETVSIVDYTIEHILPQNEKLRPEWRAELGPEWQRVQQTWLHTLGNLTLTGYNSKYGDRPFSEKRDMEDGFHHSPLKLNGGLRTLSVFDEAAIQKRAGELAERALKLWPRPKLASGVAYTYKPGAAEASGYRLTDHTNLTEGAPMRPLFDELQEKVIALDSNVTQDVRKVYVAFKAVTNVVDVVPQRDRLLLTLNMPFHELSDPQKIGRDVTGLGRWGNGDVEVTLKTSSEVPYVIGLIRQSLERQLGNTGEG